MRPVSDSTGPGLPVPVCRSLCLALCLSGLRGGRRGSPAQTRLPVAAPHTSLLLPAKKAKAAHAIAKLVALRSLSYRLRSPDGQVSEAVVVGADP